MSRRPSRTERCRDQLALKVASLESMESRSLITESLGVFTAGIGLPAAVLMARPETSQAIVAKPRASATLAGTTWPSLPVSVGGGGGAFAQTASTPSATLVAPASVVGSAPIGVPKANVITLTQASSPAGAKSGGAGGSSHGGSGSFSPAATMTNTSGAAAGGSAASSTSGAAPAPVNQPVSLNTPAAIHPSSASPSSPIPHPGGGGGLSNAMISFSNFPVYVLDQNAGSVVLPNTTRLATLGGNVDLRAQVRDTTVSSYSWNTSGLTDATAITGASSYDLKFQWDSSVSTATTNSVTLTVTNSSSQTQVQTFTFQVPAGSGTAGTGTATWPTSLAPDKVSPGAPTLGAHNVAVDANSGTFDAGIALPTYNPNVPAVVLAYDSGTAHPQPIIVGEHTLDPSLGIPSAVSAQLTFNGSAASTYYYNTSQFIPGDVQQVALQAGTSPATGRYAYSIGYGDIRGTTTTSTVSGSSTVINNSGAAFGSGWTLAGLEKVIPATGGVILDLGAGGKSLWFANGSGSTYVDPSGEFSTLVANGGGTYTRTLTDGTAIQFDSSGRELADVDTNGVALTYGYDGSSRLSTIQDHYGNTTTFAYDGTSGLLQTVTDPASRIATFTHAGTGLSGVTLPDSSTWGYAYDGSGRLTQVTDPNSKVVSVVYDSAGRVGTISNPDATSETFIASQERGFVPSGSGTSGSPAAATLLAQATTTSIDPLGNETDLYPSWDGLGLTNVTSDPLSNVSSVDRDGNGLATIAVDPLNRVTQFAYDSKGNVTNTVNPDGTTTSATYNGFSEPLTRTNELNHTVSYTYDSHANNTNTKQPLGVNATMTYSGTGQVTSDSNPGGYYASGFAFGGPPSPGGGPISYVYDAQDRLIRQTDALSETTSYGYDSASNRTTVTDPNNHTTTLTYDAMGRLLTTTDALGHTTSHAYDAAGNPTVVIDPLGHRTTTAYDAMNRVVTVTDALLGITTYSYDLDGRQASITDSVGNQTTYAYDADGRQVGRTDPNGYPTTLTYDADGEVTRKVDRDNRETDYAYDARGREVTEKWINGTVTLETVTYTYDNAGQETQVTDGTTTLTFTYDNDGRQTGAGTSGTSGQPAVTLTSTYYDSNSRAKLTDNLSSVGITSYGYDAGFRLASMATNFNGSPQEADFSYDAGGRLTALTRYTGTSNGFNSVGIPMMVSYAYDAADRLTQITDQFGGGTGISPFATYTYGYDNADRLTSESNAEGLVCYGYDNINELTGVSGARAETYTYDHNGNRTMSGYATATNNETTSGAGFTYAYDHEGNLTAKTESATGNTWAYTWDYRNRLTGVVEQTSSHAMLTQGTYTYDAMDRRIGVDEKVSGVESKTFTVYDGVNAYADFDGSGALLERYLYGPGANQILSRTSGAGTIAWYLADHEGSVRDILATNGTVIDHVAYDSYGTVTAESSASNGDRFKFDAMAWDAAINLYYDNARYFDSVAGKFLSQDPKSFGAGDANLNRFVGNGPTNHIDPSGMDWLDTGANFVAGWGDTLSFGATWGIRSGTDWATGTNWNSGIDPSSGAYLGGVVTGVVHIAIITKGRNCFPAGTPVATEHGSRSIETIIAGDLVWACDLKSYEWRLCPVITPLQHYREGDIARIEIDGEMIEATGDHPFWVIEGDGLTSRPESEHVRSQEPGSIVPGRWVDARDLRPQDRLLRRSERPVSVTGITIEVRSLRVYNMQVADLHTYAVGDAQILVHNRPPHKFAGQKVGDILKTKVGSIKTAPLPPGSPTWTQITGLTWEQIEAGAKARVIGYKVIKKLLTDGRFNL